MGYTEAGILAFRTMITPYTPDQTYHHVYASAQVLGQDRNYELPTVGIPVLATDDHGKRISRILVAEAARHLATTLFRVSRPHITADHVYTYVALDAAHRKLNGWYKTTCPLTAVRFMIESPDDCIDQAKDLVSAIYADTSGSAWVIAGAVARLRRACPA